MSPRIPHPHRPARHAATQAHLRRTASEGRRALHWEGYSMTPEQIAAWAASGESETLEFKRTTGERREAARTLCAMLNHRGGRILFGVNPNGWVIGQQVSDRTIEEVAQELREIDPPVFPSIDR